MSDRNWDTCDRGVYLVVDDGSEEFDTALKFAAHLAEANHGHLAILYVMEKQDFIHWGAIESKMNSERRKNAEERLWTAANHAHKLNGMMSSIFLEEGNPKKVIPKIIEANTEIKRLILVANAQSSSPGALVSYFSGKGFSKVNVPLLIVPHTLDDEELLSAV